MPEKNYEVSNVLADLVKPVTFRRRMYEMEENGEKKVGEYIECSTVIRGEVVRFKVAQQDSKFVKVMMRLYGYPLYGTDGVSVVQEEPLTDEL